MSVALERTFPSTTWHPDDATLVGTPVPLSRVGAERPPFRLMPSRDCRRPLDLQIRYRGGPEGLWVIQARGWHWRFSGGLCVADVMNWINRQDTKW
jgi:hypothetical protein